MMSESKLESGRSILCTYIDIYINGLGMEKDSVRTFLLFSRLSISLLLSCSSDIWPATAARSFWNVDRKDSRLSKSETLDCSGSVSRAPDNYA